MAGPRGKSWRSGARARIYHYYEHEGINLAILLGLVWDPKQIDEGFDFSVENPSPVFPELDASTAPVGVWFLKGYKCPVRVTFFRDGAFPDFVDLNAGNGWMSEVVCSPSIIVTGFSFRGT